MKIDNKTDTVFQSFQSQRRDIESRTKSFNNKKENTLKKTVAIASILGATIPLALYNAKKGKIGEIKDVFESSSSKLKDKVKATSDILEVKDIKQIGVSITGSILTGLVAGNSIDKNKTNKNERYKEGIYGFLNCMVPMSIICGLEAIAQKKEAKIGVLGKIAIAAVGIGGGMVLSNKIANGINKKAFGEDDKKFKKREIKPTDCLVHLDDILGVMVVSKVPIAKDLGKVLPLIYAHVGYETGTKQKATSGN